MTKLEWKVVAECVREVLEKYRADPFWSNQPEISIALMEEPIDAVVMAICRRFGGTRSFDTTRFQDECALRSKSWWDEMRRGNQTGGE